MSLAVGRNGSGRQSFIRDALLVSFPALVVCVFLDFFSGVFLGKFFTLIRTRYPIILVILPGLMGMRGNIFGALASRFSTMLYLGEMEPSLRDRKVMRNIFLSIVLSLIPVIFLWTVGAIKVGDPGVAVAVLLIVFMSTVYASLILGYSTALVSIIPFKKGLDPDSVAAPVITSVADLITVPLLVGFMLLYPHRSQFALMTAVAVFLLLLLGWRAKLTKRDIENTRELLMVVGGLALLSSISGSLLESYSEVIEKTLIFSVMYPMVLDTTGNIGSIIGAKTSTKIHLGELEGLFSRSILLEIGTYTALAFPLALIGNLISIGVVRFLFGKTVGIVLPFILLYPFIVFVAMWVAYFTAILGDRLGLDPDNVTVPTITTLADILSTLFVVLVARLMV
ncbi:magnesium transporter [Thermococcus pacificus]|uniref:Magnesium transporter MgtE n=1 Tax=Thermococcus pacificus TaxID=71998 RepID=A0A218P936_9EURY|nr:magnesium transporter [Thermococcus pacificus]ASJ07278.1 magnesium transporter MgtE [Thermococcus pacificus]